MINRTASIGSLAIVVALVGVLGFLGDLWSGHFALACFGVGCLLNVIWFVGVLAGGVRDELRRPRP